MSNIIFLLQSTNCLSLGMKINYRFVNIIFSDEGFTVETSTNIINLVDKTKLSWYTATDTAL